MPTTQRRDWEDLSKLDPYWAILSDPARRHGGWDLDAFLARGREDVAAVMDSADEIGRPVARDAALDFGCGAGRLTIALADHFASCVGVDISEPMIEEARRIASADNVRFAISDAPDLSQFADASFDLVLSHIVLQHVPEREAKLRYISEFVRVLRPGGLARFQLPSHIPPRNRLQVRPRLYAILRRAGVRADTLYKRLGLYPIRMTAIPAAEVEACVQAAGGRVLRTDERRSASGPVSAEYSVTRD